MTPNRLQQIEALFHSALEASPGERVALLANSDPELRRAVEALLARRNDSVILDHPLASPSDETMTVVGVGTRLGPYQIESKLGEGGMGEVFRAVDTRLGRPVAIKFVHHQFSARFEREARAISSLNHPHICTLHDVGPNYLVMELIEGETIAARLKSGPLQSDAAVHYASQIASALAEAHEHGIVHRDLKPGNIMLVKSGVKVLDFGLASREGDEAITQSRMVIGTPAYMAPEQRDGKPADARTDIYSFGCVLYEMLTGERASSDRKPLPSNKLEKLVRRCLEPNPSRRWQSAVELASALQDLQSAAPSGIWRAITVVSLIALLIAAYFLLRPKARLTDKDTIVLADFTNSTGDPIFDGTLRQGLAIQLEQSPFLKVMDDQEVQGVLGRMNLSSSTRITNQVAHEICLREGAAATIDGAIASLGKSYVLTLQAIACQNGSTLAREQVQAADKEHVLNAVGSAATAMRVKLGEPGNTIQKLNRPLEEVTTPSLEALQSYSAGYSDLAQGNFLAAIPLFERAIEIDPNFAMAYQFLGGALFTAGDKVGSTENAEHAFRLADRVSEYERSQIVLYHYDTTGELDKEIDALQLGIRNFPRAGALMHNQLSLIYIDMGRYEDGLKEARESSALWPDADPGNRRQLDALICLDRLREAKEFAEKLRARGLDTTRVHQRFFELAYVEGDEAAISKEIQWFAGKPEEYLSLGLQAANLNVHGRRSESRKWYQRAAESARRQRLPSVAAEYEEADARADAFSGICNTARKLGRPALALAICGDATQAEKLAAETSKAFPKGTIWNAVQLPEIRATIAMNREEPGKSVELLLSALPYERSYISSAYLRGLAYLRLHKGAEAVAEFRKIVNHKGANWGATWIHPWWGQFYSLSYLGMARGYAFEGDGVRARNAFQDFFDLWTNADTDLPVLREAREEFARLK
jgi:tetratricopeptide (TPR) repeat protein